MQIYKIKRDVYIIFEIKTEPFLNLHKSDFVKRRLKHIDY